MFVIAAQVGSHEEHFIDLVNQHFINLQKTNLVEEIQWVKFHDLLLAFDTGSPFAEIQQTSKSLTFIGGWKHNPLEQWSNGEYIQIEFGINNDQTYMCAYSDRAGSWPVYAGESQFGVALGNDVLGIARGLKLSSLNTNVIDDFLLYGHAITRETSVTHIDRLWPGERFVTASERNERPTLTIEQIPNWGLESYSDKLEEVTAESVLDALRSDVSTYPKLDSNSIVQLSGGLDSRLSAAVLSEQNDQIITATIKFEDSEELLVAKQVAETLKSKHVELTLSELHETDLRNGWLLTGGQINPYAAAGNLPLYKTEIPGVSGNFRKIYGAWPGDCLIGSYIPVSNIFLDKRYFQISKSSWLRSREMGTKALKQASGRSFARISRVNRSRSRFKREFQQICNGELIQTISYWAMFRRQPAFSYISPARLTSSILEITPVLGGSYLKSLLRLSPFDIYGKNFYRRMIYRGFPKLRNINYQNTGAPITETIVGTNQKFPFSDLLKSILPKSIVMFLGKILNILNGNRVKSNEISETEHWLALPLFQEIIGSPLIIAGQKYELSKVTSNKTKLVFASIILGFHWTEDYINPAFPNKF